jgi:hypothetical protein
MRSWQISHAIGTHYAVIAVPQGARKLLTLNQDAKINWSKDLLRYTNPT